MDITKKKTNGSTTVPEKENMLQRTLTEVYENMAVTDETSCGFRCCQGFANKKVYIFVYGLAGAIFGATYAYFNGTLTTMEKRFKIPSRTTGIITVGNDISAMFLTLFITYYTSRSHRPRVISMGLYTVVIFCMLNALPHFLYGPGEDALKLTKEYGDVKSNMSAFSADNKGLCQDVSNTACDNEGGNIAPPLILFLAQFVSGVGGALYYTLGIAYMDDNIKKDKTPMLISVSYFIRMLGPAAGYGLSSMCLKMYISPSLTPTITPQDPRWLGAWWIGWIVLGIFLSICSFFMFLFPKTLPRAAARKILLEENKALTQEETKCMEEEKGACIADMIITLKRLFRNKILMYNNFASLFYFFGYSPYWLFLAKYMEIIFKKSASEASFLTGYVGILFSALGLVTSGWLISKLKPSARYLAGWNVFVGFYTVVAIYSYYMIGCPGNENKMSILSNGELQLNTTCNMDCNCDHVKYSPVCAPGDQTYISPCHAGCKDLLKLADGTKVFANCSCVDYDQLTATANSTSKEDDPWYVRNGPCAVDCSKNFLIFMLVLSSVKFVGATGRLSNFLVAVRCVDEKDKAVALGFGGTLMSLFAFIPAPIIFGYIIDQTCLVWGKTCSGTGNCWLYNPESVRLYINGTSVVLVSFGVLFDIGVWYYVKDLKIFDDETEDKKSKEKPKTSELKNVT